MQLLLIFLIDQDILITEIIIKTVELLRQTKTLILMVILTTIPLASDISHRQPLAYDNGATADNLTRKIKSSINSNQLKFLCICINSSIQNCLQ